MRKMNIPRVSGICAPYHPSRDHSRPLSRLGTTAKTILISAQISSNLRRMGHLSNAARISKLQITSRASERSNLCAGTHTSLVTFEREECPPHKFHVIFVSDAKRGEVYLGIAIASLDAISRYRFYLPQCCMKIEPRSVPSRFPILLCFSLHM